MPAIGHRSLLLGGVERWRSDAFPLAAPNTTPSPLSLIGNTILTNKKRREALGPATYGGGTPFATSYLVTYDGTSFYINGVLLVAVAGVEEFSLAFSNDGYPAVAYSTSSGIYVHHRSGGSFVTTPVNGSGSSPLICLTSSDPSLIASSENIVAFINDNNTQFGVVSTVDFDSEPLNSATIVDAVGVNWTNTSTDALIKKNIDGHPSCMYFGNGDIPSSVSKTFNMSNNYIYEFDGRHQTVTVGAGGANAWVTIGDIILYVDVDGRLKIYSNVAATNVIDVVAPALLSWDTYRIERSGANITLSINGSTVGTYSSLPVATPSTVTVYLGTNQVGTQPIRGWIDNVYLENLDSDTIGVQVAKSSDTYASKSTVLGINSKVKLTKAGMSADGQYYILYTRGGSAGPP